MRISRKAFKGREPLAGESPELARSETILVAGMARPVGEGFEYKSYRIHRAKHGSPFRHQEIAARHGEHLVVAVHDSAGTVGFVRRDLLWVHPDHRGHGLGPEMAAELLVFMGCEDWTPEQWRNWLDTPKFTKSGLHNRFKMHDVLVRRGIIES